MPVQAHSYKDGYGGGHSRGGDHFRIGIDRKRHELDEVHIKVELTERVFIGELKDLGEVKCSVEDKLKAVLNLRTVVELVERGAIPRTVGMVQGVGYGGRVLKWWMYQNMLYSINQMIQLR
jgi:hypothetical protein